MAYENRGLIKKFLDTDFPQITNESRAHVLSRDDYFAAAWIGLFRAAKKYDRTKGKFSTYAYQWIRQSVIRAYHTDGFIAVRCPIYLHAIVSEMRKKHGQAFETAIEKCENPNILSAYRSYAQSVSLDAAKDSGEGDKTTGKDDLVSQGVQPLKNLEDEERGIFMHNALMNLTSRERTIVRMYFGYNGPEMTLEQIGRFFKLSAERINQIRMKALQKMKRFLARENITKEMVLA